MRERYMCLAVPGKIISIVRDENAFIAAWVEFGGVRRKISLDLTPEARQGDYVIVHAGMALSILDEAEALETLDTLEKIAGRDTGGE
jgi:hydrogenase expression/formation protein HypC